MTTLAGRYEIRGPIGEGGMQVVLLADDLVFRRQVAIKRAKSNSALKRFTQSAKLSASINHPNIAKTLDYFVEDGTQYLVEEYLEGGDLSHGLRARLERVDPYLVARIAHHLAKGLRAAHAAGVVHRDIKPANILFESNALEVRVKFTDFGIAKMAEQEISESVSDGSTSSSSTFLGAIPYMAPEMMKNKRISSFPADIWSFAAVTYELLSGKLPFGSGIDAIDAIRSGTLPPSPKDHHVRRQFVPLTEALWDILKSCLQTQPECRPTAAQLVQLCEKLCYPVAARQVGVVELKRYNWGVIATDSGADVFYHNANVYGPIPKEGDRVMFSAYPGTPNPRAIPVVKLR